MAETTGAMPMTRRPGWAVLATVVLTSGLMILAHPVPALAAFTGTNGEIAFQSNRSGANQVYTMWRDGTSQTKFSGVNEKSSAPAWSPDGTALAFANCCDQGTDQLEVYIANASGTGTTRLTNNTSRDGDPAWSPDAEQIAFVASRDGNKEIYVMGVDGKGETNLTNDSSKDDSPSWSPDGSQIAFASKRAGNWDIWVMDSDGSGASQLTNNAAKDTDPDWSPDGTQIVFVSDRGGDKDVYTKNADLTAKATNITDDPSRDDHPVWSPNGDKIAFDSDRTGNDDIWKVNPDGSKLVQLTTDPGTDRRPSWQPVTAPLFEGLDVSHWQDTIDFDAVAADGIRFIFQKASEGTDYVDPTYETNRANAEAAGLAFGAYHYARPSTTQGDAIDEADHFIDTAQPVSGELIPVIDLEDSGGLSDDKLTTWLWDFLDQVLARTGVHALIYTSPNFWEVHLNDTDEFAKGGYSLLWIAHWFASTPTVPGNNWGGHGWTFWQNDNCFKVDGITGCVDHDYYNGVVLTPALIP
jgi:Tol biopolymer transport system component/GH25 family lysozyme M1 (1,4-beta-N-acetylmuramidase)